MQFIALRDFDAAKEAPDVFVLDHWRAELVDLFFDLYGMLERGLVHAYFYGKEVPASHWIGRRPALEHVLKDKEVLGLRNFMLQAAELTKHYSVDVGELSAAIARPSVETSASEYREEGAPRAASAPQAQSGSSKKLAPKRDAARKPLTPAQSAKLVVFLKERFRGGASNQTVMGQACEAELGREILRGDLRRVFKDAGVRGRVGRPKKSGR
jgi:hypothetical protein